MVGFHIFWWCGTSDPCGWIRSRCKIDSQVFVTEGQKVKLGKTWNLTETRSQCWLQRYNGSSCQANSDDYSSVKTVAEKRKTKGYLDNNREIMMRFIWKLSYPFFKGHGEDHDVLKKYMKNRRGMKGMRGSASPSGFCRQRLVERYGFYPWLKPRNLIWNCGYWMILIFLPDMQTDVLTRLSTDSKSIWCRYDVQGP